VNWKRTKIHLNNRLLIQSAVGVSSLADESALLVGDREDAASMVTAGATANTTEGNSRASRESGLLCSHSHGESIVGLGDEVSERVDR